MYMIKRIVINIVITPGQWTFGVSVEQEILTIK